MAIWGAVSSISTFAPLSNWHPGSDHSFIPPSLAPESQKSGSPATGFRERERSFDMGRTAGPCAPADGSFTPGPQQWPACDDSWTDRQGIIPRFLF